MNHTPEQTTILNHVVSDAGKGLTLIDSVAGSGKTTMLVSIANTIPHTNACYLAYNKSIATEASRKFPKSTNCVTTHSLAYQATVKPMKLKLGIFNYRNIEERLDYTDKVNLVNAIREFCLSKFTTFDDFIADRQLAVSAPLANKYLAAMQSGKIDCTHEFYLKLFHILLANEELQYDPFDFLMLDEAGDLNEVTLEIFRLLPAIRKIAVGDPFQNIYTFNHTINCFEVLQNEGTIFRMSKSFRVADFIATRIEKFCQTYLDPKMSFLGIPMTDSTIRSQAYITRTNSALISKMIELNTAHKPYGLVRKATEIFKMPLMLIGLKHKGFITDAAYKHLQSDVDRWYETTSLQREYKTVLRYIAKVHEDDFTLQQAVRLIGMHGVPAIMQAYKEARNHERSDQSYILTTAHSCKGLEFDEVTIASDLNESISKPLALLKTDPCTMLQPNELESLNLYYVACTRAAKALNNAQYL